MLRTSVIILILLSFNAQIFAALATKAQSLSSATLIKTEIGHRAFEFFLAEDLAANNSVLVDSLQGNELIKLVTKDLQEVFYASKEIVVKLKSADAIEDLEAWLTKEQIRAEIVKVFSFNESLLQLKTIDLDIDVLVDLTAKLNLLDFVELAEIDFTHNYHFENPVSDKINSQRAALSLPILEQEPSLLEFDLADENAEKFIPSDPLFKQQWHLQNTKQISGAKPDADIDAPEAWVFSKGRGVKVAVLDTGFDTQHIDLNTRIVAQHDFIEDDDDASNDSVFETHGTNTSSLVAAAENDFGVIGVAPEAELILVRIAASFRFASESKIAEAIAYAVEEGADVISNSWQSYNATNDKVPPPIAIVEAINFAHEKGRNGLGTAVLFASGNHDDDIDHNKFTKIPGIIVVAASDYQDNRSVYSNFGERIFISAPSSVNKGNIAGITTATVENNHINSFSGTSASTPIAAGVVALMISLDPSLDLTTLKEIIKQSADKIGAEGEYDEDGHSLNFGFGRINAQGAVLQTLANKVGHENALENSEPGPKKVKRLEDLGLENIVYGNRNSALSANPLDLDSSVGGVEANLVQLAAGLSRKRQRRLKRKKTIQLKVSDTLEILRLSDSQYRVYVFDTKGRRLKSRLLSVESAESTQEIFTIESKIKRRHKNGVGVAVLTDLENRALVASEFLID